MNIENLKTKLKPKLYEHKLEGETVYIHRPSARDFSKCDNVENTLIYCVKDENGDQFLQMKILMDVLMYHQLIFNIRMNYMGQF